MLLGVPGQALLMYLPPPEVHSVVGRQTPGAPPEPVHGPLTVDRSRRMCAWIEVMLRRRIVERREVSCILSVGLGKDYVAWMMFFCSEILLYYLKGVGACFIC